MRTISAAFFLYLFTFCNPVITCAQDTIKVGAIFYTSGFGALGGKEELNGLTMARDDINLHGGIGGKKIELIVEDNKSDLKLTTTAFKKLASIDKVSAVIGPNWAEFTEVVAPLTDQLQLPTISPSGWKKGLLPKHKYLYSLLPPHRLGARPLAEALEQGNFKRIGLVTTQNTFLISFAEALEEQLSKSKVVERVDVLPDTTDFRTIIGKLNARDLDGIVVLIDEGGGLLSFLRQYRQLAIRTPLFACWFLYHADQKAILAAGEGVVSIEYTAAGTPEFKALYNKRFGVPASGSAARAYDALYVLKQAVERCGPSRVKIQECLGATDLIGSSGHIKFSPGHENLDDAPVSALITVKDGKYFRVDSKLTPTEIFSQ